MPSTPLEVTNSIWVPFRLFRAVPKWYPNWSDSHSEGKKPWRSAFLNVLGTVLDVAVHVETESGDEKSKSMFMLCVYRMFDWCSKNTDLKCAHEYAVVAFLELFHSLYFL